MEKISPSWSGHSFTQRTVLHGTAAVSVGYSETTSSIRGFAYGAGKKLPFCEKISSFLQICMNVLVLMAEATIPLLIKIFNVITKRRFLHLFCNFRVKINYYNGFSLTYAVFMEKRFTHSLLGQFAASWENRLERFDPWLLSSSFLCIIINKWIIVASFSHSFPDHSENEMSSL